MLNPDTRVAVCCYAGDRHQVEAMLDIVLHHECPVVILSPEDAAVGIQHPGVENRPAGPNEYTGYKSIARFRQHLEMLLTFPESFFLINDADSFCLTPKLPDYLYAEPGVLWSNIIKNEVPQQQQFFPEGFPHVAFQPPWFLSRSVIKTLLAVAGDVAPNPGILFIDYWLVQLAFKAGLKWRGVPGAFSIPTWEPFWTKVAADAVRHRGATFVHAVKTREVCDILMLSRKQYVAGHPNEQ